MTTESTLRKQGSFKTGIISDLKNHVYCFLVTHNPIENTKKKTKFVDNIP